jgi:predicted CopG family antitoxin
VTVTTTKTKLIRVNEELHSELAKIGSYGDSMGDIIQKLLESYQRNNNINVNINNYKKSMMEEKFIAKVAREVGDNLKQVRKRQRY